MRIEHVQLAMPVGGEDLARAFFIGALGLREVPKPRNLAGRGGCWFEGEDVKLHLGVQMDFVPATKAHPAFLVRDLSLLRTQLAAMGIECNDDEPIDGYDRTYVSDPFGNRIELMQRTGAS